MIAISISAVVIALAVLVGLGSVRLVRSYTLWLAIPASVVLSLTAATVAGGIYLSAALSYPSLDQWDWSAKDSIKVYVDAPVRPETIDRRALIGYSHGWGNNIDLSKLDQDYMIELRYPVHPKSGDDISVELSIMVKFPLKTMEMRAVLFASDSMKMWTTQECTSKEGTGRTACILTADGRTKVNFSWTASSVSAGTRQLALQFPQLWQGSDWMAVLQKGYAPILACGRRSFDTSCTDRLKVLTASSSDYKAPDSDFSVDMDRREISFPIEVTTTLGVSSNIYNWLALVGVVLSGALGSGWVFKVADVIRDRSRKPTHKPFRPAENRKIS